MLFIAVPGVNPMYSSESGCASAGTVPSIDEFSPGFVPQVTTGRTDAPSIVTTRWYSASGSGCSEVQLVGLGVVSARDAAVFSSGAMTPAVAPASIAMLQTVMRPSIESLLIAEPQYSSA